MSRPLEVKVSVGLTKALPRQYEFIRIDIAETHLLEEGDDAKAVYEKAWASAEGQMMTKLAELHQDEVVNKEIK